MIFIFYRDNIQLIWSHNLHREVGHVFIFDIHVVWTFFQGTLILFQWTLINTINENGKGTWSHIKESTKGFLGICCWIEIWNVWIITWIFVSIVKVNHKCIAVSLVSRINIVIPSRYSETRITIKNSSWHYLYLKIESWTSFWLVFNFHLIGSIDISITTTVIFSNDHLVWWKLPMLSSSARIPSLINEYRSFWYVIWHLLDFLINLLLKLCDVFINRNYYNTLYQKSFCVLFQKSVCVLLQYIS